MVPMLIVSLVCLVLSACFAFYAWKKSRQPVSHFETMNGLLSRSDYERDIQVYDKEFAINQNLTFIFLFVDINNLRSVNGLYGHSAGDAYISHIADLLTRQLDGAEHIYRMGGDDFLAIYRGQEESVVTRDVHRLRRACEEEGKKGRYQTELAMGYAVSNPEYHNLRDVMRVADYMMFRNKAEIKRDLTFPLVSGIGTQLNLMGLTDRVFDAMCLSSEQFYPFLTNLETNVTRVAPALCDFFGLEGEFLVDFLGQWQELVHPEDRPEFLDDIIATLTEKKQYHFCHYRVRGKDGEYVEVTCRGGVYHGRDGEPNIFAGYMVNHGVPETVDRDTGLLNGFMLRERLKEILRTNDDAVILRIEANNINRIRMLYGSDVAGVVFRNLGDLCARLTEDTGTAYSENGKIILALKGRSQKQAEDLYRRIREACSTGIASAGGMVPVSLTAGGVLLPSRSLTNSDAVYRALLYATEDSQENHHNALTFFEAESGSGNLEEMSLLMTVHRDCVSNRERFYLRYQPIIDVQSGEIRGAEALLRWRSPEGEEVQPSRFIAFLENDPGYNALGFEIIRMAAVHARRFADIRPGFAINVNITALQLYAEDFIPGVMRILEEVGLSPRQLILELTERCKEMDFAFLKARVDELRARGIRVALDDMGTGFSSLDLLLHLPVDEIKLDWVFTQELQQSGVDLLYARVLCQAAQANAIALCFEGVETAEMQEFLKQFGDLLVQGYYYDMPLLPEEFEQRYLAP